MATDGLAAAREPIAVGERGRRLGRAVRVLRRMSITGLLGGTFLLVLVLAAILAPLVTVYDPNKIDTAKQLLSPSTSNWFGTDQVGRDIFTRIIFGARYTLGASLVVCLIAATTATVIAVVSGYFGGVVDMAVQRVVDGWIAFPPFILLIALISLVGPDLRNVVVVLSLAMAGPMSRIIRSNVLAIKQTSYVEAARLLGATHLRAIVFHIAPQVVPLVLILASIQLGSVVLVLAALGFLGYGVPPPTPEWGSMLSGRARDFMYSAWWLAFFPGLAISLAVLSLNLFFDSLRDMIDPRMRGTGRGL